MDQQTRNILRILIARYHADRRASEAYTDPRAARIAKTALDSFMNNLASELRPLGITLEGIE